jgi:hypothetical protein
MADRGRDPRVAIRPATGLVPLPPRRLRMTDRTRMTRLNQNALFPTVIYNGARPPLAARLQPHGPIWGCSLASARMTHAALRAGYSTSSTSAGSPPKTFCANAAAMNWSRSPSSTAPVFEVETPVRRSFTIW